MYPVIWTLNSLLGYLLHPFTQQMFPELPGARLVFSPGDTVGNKMDKALPSG